MFQINQPIPRQYLRKLTAEAIDRPELADWNKYPEYDTLNAARAKLIPLFSEKKDV